MQFLTLFLMTYLEAKFDLIVMEKNDIYWKHGLEKEKLVERSACRVICGVCFE
jgi:hypothetical protein